jgi:predicted metalloenzyme YecM
MVHPFSPDWYVGGSVLVSGRSTSIVEVTRFQFQRFTVSVKELAEWFGLEVARIVVDECLAQRQNRMAKYLQRPVPKCNGYLGIVVPNKRPTCRCRRSMSGV